MERTLNQTRTSTKPFDKGWYEKVSKSVKEDKSVIEELADRISTKMSKVKPVKEQVDDLIEDANYARDVLKYTTEWSNTTLAKDLGMRSAQELLQELQSLGIVYQDKRKQWVLRARFSGQGLEVYHTNKKGTYLRWTQKGRQWLHALVKRGILQISPKPIQTTQEHKPKMVVMPKPKRNTANLVDLIEQMKACFDCIINLAIECLDENDENWRKVLRDDIRSINDSTPLMMRKFEDECYKVLAVS